MDEYLRLSGGADKAQQARIKQVSILVSSTKKKNLYFEGEHFMRSSIKLV